MVGLNHVHVTILLGLIIVGYIWYKTKKFPEYLSLFQGFLAGGLLYASISAFYWSFTSNFLLDDSFETLKLIVFLAGLAFLRLTYDVIIREC